MEKIADMIPLIFNLVPSGLSMEWSQDSSSMVFISLAVHPCHAGLIQFLMYSLLVLHVDFDLFGSSWLR